MKARLLKFFFLTAVVATLVSFAWGFVIHTYTTLTLTSPTVGAEK